ncbi:MAG: hypothetical protein ACRD68_05610, partial [Pyrinomonadaceae bacterium]
RSIRPEEIMRKRNFATPFFAAALALALSATALADTIRLRDGTVIRGQIVSFRDQQFTVLIGSGARGRRSRITLYMEDVESIEFDAAEGSVTTSAGGNDDTATGTPDSTRTTDPRPAPTDSRPPVRRETDNTASANPPATTSSPSFFQINVRVRADNTANGWTNSGLVVRRGQRLRITSSGRVSLGGGRFSTPTGLPRVLDPGKLMRDEPTGGLIAVIGDDNDQFIFIGAGREFEATRDGILFLGVNEANLNDNSGSYDARIEAEATTGNSSR